jgi:hypothetical protein
VLCLCLSPLCTRGARAAAPQGSPSARARAARRTELNVLQKVHHPHAVQFLGAVTTSRPYMLVYEFLPGGSLLDMCAPARARARVPPRARRMRPRRCPRTRAPAGRPVDQLPGGRRACGEPHAPAPRSPRVGARQ